MSLQYFSREIIETLVLALALMFICVTGNPDGDKILTAAACMGIALATTGFRLMLSVSDDVGHLFRYLEQQEQEASEKGKKK